ncbi:Symplekin [Artemisia annua]|uniref:Symplekin n=1 Tax=Artemisia annua TaxID=35608 RepID=A0A2U1L3P9_ARTAN|nr:Symplekin [Artemisia annua]
MSSSQREQALSLLAAANNHGDLAVKLSSLKQAKDIIIISSIDDDFSLFADQLFPYLVQLQSSHHSLALFVSENSSKFFVEFASLWLVEFVVTDIKVVEDISLKTMEHSPVLMPVLLTLLNDDDPVVARHSIVSGTHIFCSVLEELALQFHRHGFVERWLDEMWSWMLKFKDAVSRIALEARLVGPRLLAIKFLETCVLLFMPDNDSRGQIAEAVPKSSQVFNISWLAGGHPVLDSIALQSEANRSFMILLDLLSLATIGRRRQVHYSSVLSALLDFDANLISKGAHTPSIQYSLRTAFLGFLRSTHPVIMEGLLFYLILKYDHSSREKLLKVLRAMNAGDAADQVMRQVDKMIRNGERAARDARASKDEQPSSHMLKRSTPMDQEHIVSSDSSSKRSRYGSIIQSESGQNHSVNGVSTKAQPLANETESHDPENITFSLELVPDEQATQVGADMEFNIVSDVATPPIDYANKELNAEKSTDIVMTDEEHSLSFMDDDQLSPCTVDTPVLEETSVELPVVPSYVELTEKQQKDIRKLAIKRIIDSYKQLRGAEFMQTRMALLSRLVAQVDADDDVIMMIQKHIVSDYQDQKGHELVMHVLYHLHALKMSDSSEDSSVAFVYEKFLLGVAKCLLDVLPANDKSFSRLFSEAPFLPESAFKLLDDICCSDNNCGKDIRDGDRVHQGLGSLWSLILGRPNNRQAFLDIALRCAVHPKDDIRSKAIRLVANKLYVIEIISEKIEDFATNKLLSAVNKPVSEAEQRTEGQIGSQETSISGSQISEPGTSSIDPATGSQSDSQSDSSMSPALAQQHLSLFFALCIKKPSLLQLVFDRYHHAPKAVKQAIHRHVPILIRALGPSYKDLLKIISDPPQGSENLLTLVMQVMCEGTTPSADLVATVKRLYETKLKDATILIPILSTFTKDEVLPIFPRLVQLPLDKFQTALAHILQGSAHMGPALTPAEVLVAIHDISPEKDGVPLKKVMDACSACFEQRTVFTQQVLAKALNQMVDQTPLPLLFMRTVIQAIDAFPKLVDFVMELLSKLVSKQVWRMPKLWVGFLKCISQTQPHSFRVLLQLPSPQLEGALNKYGSLRGPLAAYANQPSIKASLPRYC